MSAPRTQPRLRRTPEAWRAIFQHFERSGLTVAQFCQREHIPLSTFHRWRHLLGDPHPNEATDPNPVFIDAGPLRPPAAALSITLDLGGGITLHLARA
jgi:hypothetical protein